MLSVMGHLLCCKEPMQRKIKHFCIWWSWWCLGLKRSRTGLALCGSYKRWAQRTRTLFLSVCVCECNPRAKNTTHHLCSKTPSCSPELLARPVISLYNITPGPPPPPDDTRAIPEVIRPPSMQFFHPKTNNTPASLHFCTGRQQYFFLEKDLSIFTQLFLRVVAKNITDPVVISC